MHEADAGAPSRYNVDQTVHDLGTKSLKGWCSTYCQLRAIISPYMQLTRGCSSIAGRTYRVSSAGDCNLLTSECAA